jgi:phosphoglycerate dehydrogenase-like enzyme
LGFRRIVAVDYTGLVATTREKLRQLADEVIFYDDFPKSNQEIISRIGDADCVLVSWNTKIDREVMMNCSGIKYIGMCCSLIDEKSANVDIAAAREQGIQVLGVKDYGDEGVIEYIIAELIRLLKGTGKHQWKQADLELTGQSLGIIGMGTLGTMLAEKALAFGMEVFYYNRSRKADVEAVGVQFLELDKLLQRVDIISTHLPRNTVILDKKLGVFGDNKILINTTLEPTFDVEEFGQWIGHRGNYAIFDRVAMGQFYDELKKHDRVIYTDKVAGWTEQAKHRLSEKVLENIHKF